MTAEAKLNTSVLTLIETMHTICITSKYNHTYELFTKYYTE